MLAQFKVVKIVDVSVMPTGMLLGRFNLPGNSPESEIQIERKMGKIQELCATSNSEFNSGN